MKYRININWFALFQSAATKRNKATYMYISSILVQIHPCSLLQISSHAVFLILFLKNMSRKQLIKFKHSVYQTEQKYGSTYKALYGFKVQIVNLRATFIYFYFLAILALLESLSLCQRGNAFHILKEGFMDTITIHSLYLQILWKQSRIFAKIECYMNTLYMYNALILSPTTVEVEKKVF